MMTVISKRMMGVVSIFAVLQYILVPVVVLADDASEDAGTSQEFNAPLHRKAAITAIREQRIENIQERKENRQEVSCDRIINLGNKFLQHKQDKINRVSEKVENREQYNEERRNSLSVKWSDDREKHDEARGKMYGNLEELAKTDEQKAAVKKFQDTVEQAVSDRRAAMDDAIKSFQDDVDALVKSKKQSSGEVAGTFEEAVWKAVDDARAECNSNVDPKTVRGHLLDAIKSARADMVKQRKGFENIKDEIQKLIEKRKSAVESARKTFLDTMDSAREELKTALSA